MFGKNLAFNNDLDPWSLWTKVRSNNHSATQRLLGNVMLIWAASWQNQQNGMCAQQRLRSACPSTQSDQSSLSEWRKLGSLATRWGHSEDSDQTGRMQGWSESSLGAHAILLVLSWVGSFVWLQKVSFKDHHVPFSCIKYLNSLTSLF